MSSAAHRLDVTIERTVARARRRIRLQRALERGTGALVPAAGVFFVALLLYKLEAVDAGALFATGAAAAAIVLIGFAWGLLWPVPAVEAARALDARADLADRVGSAWDFAHAGERTPFMEAAIRDAVEKARALRVRRFFKLSQPRGLPMALAALAAVGVLVAARFAAPLPSRAALSPAPLPPPLIPPFQAMLARDKLEETRKEAERAKDRDAKKVLDKLDRLWKGIAERKFDKLELWRRIAALQRQKIEGLSRSDQQELGRLRRMGEKMGKGSVAKALSGALKRSDLAKAQEALRELARRLKDNRLSKRERRELERMLKRAAQQATGETRKELQSMRRKLEKLRKELRKRDLQKLSREKKERELERLSRELEKLQSQQSLQISQELMDALKQMKRYADADAGRSLEKAGQRLQELLKRLRRMQLMARTQDHIREMKELLRRGGNQGRDDQLKEFFLRARGRGPGDLTLWSRKDGQGEQGRPGGQSGQCQKCGGSHPTNQHGGHNTDPSKEPGKGVGTGTDFRLGPATDLKDAKYSEKRIAGKKGRGDSTSEIFYGAATKGFSRVGYKNVYVKYKEAVEEALEKNQGIPHGQKRIVEKYFEMIRPK